jgi:plasmid stabilization system protein ParE
MTYRLTRRPRRDMLAIWVHTAENNEPAADRLIDLPTNHFKLLGKNPYLGRSRDDLRLG